MKHQEVVLITGASSGIGRSTAIYLASKGLGLCSKKNG